MLRGWSSLDSPISASFVDRLATLLELVPAALSDRLSDVRLLPPARAGRLLLSLRDLSPLLGIRILRQQTLLVLRRRLVTSQGIQRHLRILLSGSRLLTAASPLKGGSFLLVGDPPHSSSGFPLGAGLVSFRRSR